jgi:hypothetical protein
MIPCLAAVLQVAPPIAAPVLPLAVATILAVAAIGVSLFAVWRSQALVLLADERARTGLERCEASVEALRKTADGLAAQLREFERHPSVAPLPGSPRLGLNLCKRSQVLRMHRKGDPPDQIAAALEVPRQEIDLLIKVHRIVIGNL